MDPNTRALIMGAAGAGGAAASTYVEDVFSTWLYTGNGSTQTITNGIDLSGKGGLVWTKGRNNPGYSLRNTLVDTVRGLGSAVSLHTDGTEGQGGSAVPNDITAFTSSGYSLSAPGGYQNNSGNSYASWTFRKQAKFFDVVTYTGNGVAGRAISHSLGSTPGFIVVKRTNTTGAWYCLHTGSGTAYRGQLNSDAAFSTSNLQFYWGDGTSYIAPTSSTFTVYNSADVNALNDTYVAYLFAHDAGGFGDSGNDSIIKCGSYVGSTTVDLGFEPQLVIVKQAIGGTGNWYMFDSMRGMLADNSSSAALEANTASAESVSNYGFSINATGFSTTGIVGISGRTYIYIAIRRGPMKTPTDATKVFDTVARSVSSPNLFSTALSYVDLIIDQGRSGQPALAQTRLAGDGYLRTTATNAEQATGVNPFNYNGKVYPISWGGSGTSEINWMFRRAPGFFDAVAYTGTGVARTVSHNLGVAPELMIVKSRSGAYNWIVYSSALGNTKGLIVNGADGAITVSTYWNNTSPTSSVFTVGTSVAANENTITYIAYLFATCPGVSKVGSYTGTGTTLNVDCGFTNGARFVLIKRTDSTGDWYVWDTARGIVSGNDPYLLLNSTAAEVTNTDYIDPLSSGFQISSSAPVALNATGGSFIYLAIA